VGLYLSERQWGTVREDYSANGDAWNYFSHDQARSRAYRWREDGIAGVSDDQQILCFSLALWNGVDPILKERLFGLTNSEGESWGGCEGVLLLHRLDAENGAGLGASHQTGWTGVIAYLMKLGALVTPAAALATESAFAASRVEPQKPTST
jgi:hypothetical protein